MGSSARVSCSYLPDACVHGGQARAVCCTACARFWCSERCTDASAALLQTSQLGLPQADLAVGGCCLVASFCGQPSFWSGAASQQLHQMSALTRCSMDEAAVPRLDACSAMQARICGQEHSGDGAGLHRADAGRLGNHRQATADHPGPQTACGLPKRPVSHPAAPCWSSGCAASSWDSWGCCTHTGPAAWGGLEVVRCLLATIL